MIDPVDVLESQLLDILSIKRHESSVFDYQFGVIRESFLNNDVRAVDFGLLRLDYFRDNLQILKDGDEDCFKRVAKDLRQSKNDDLSFYGFRFEAYIASRLVREGISVLKRERPDFEINNSNRVFIECGSARSRGGEESISAFQKKITDLLSFKESKVYASGDCVLFLDVTNLHYCIEADDWQILINSLTETVKCSRNPDLYGSIILFLQVYSQNTRTITYKSNRIDSPKCDAKLLQFLDTYFLHAGSSTQGPAIPRET